MNTGRRVALVAGCLTALALAYATLALTADTSPITSRRLFGLWKARHAALAASLVIAAVGLLAAAASRRALFGFLATAVSVLGGLALLETASVLGVVSWPAVFASRVPQLGTLPVPYLDVSGTTYQDTASRWGLPSEPMPYRYRTDRRGYRNDVDRDAADIYLLGDSVLVAPLVPFPETVTGRLEKATGRPVAQIALIGKSPQEEQQLFRDTGLEVRGRLVIQFIFEGNDLLDSRRFRNPAGREASISREGNSLTLQIVLLLQRLTQPVAGAAALRTCAIGDRTYTFLWARESFAGVEGEAAVISDALQRFAAEIRDAGGAFGVVFVPSKLRVLGPLCRFPPGSELSNFAAHLGTLRDHLGDWSKTNGIDLLDLTEPLSSAARADRIPWFWGDSHWNAEGHAVAAEVLATWQPIRRARTH